MREERVAHQTPAIFFATGKEERYTRATTVPRHLRHPVSRRGMSNSLGLRQNFEMRASERPMSARASLPAPTLASSTPSTSSVARVKMTTCSLKGFFPLMLFSSLLLSVPIVVAYADLDYSDAATRGAVVATPVLVVLATLLANDLVVWFNMVLFFHLGMEVQVLDVLMDFARESGTSDAHSALAWTAFVVVILHLVPFFLVDQSKVLCALASAGVVVNAVALLYVSPPLLTPVGFSSFVLLLLTVLTRNVCDVSCSLRTSLLSAVKQGSFVRCDVSECD